MLLVTKVLMSPVTFQPITCCSHNMLTNPSEFAPEVIQSRFTSCCKVADENSANELRFIRFLNNVTNHLEFNYNLFLWLLNQVLKLLRMKHSEAPQLCEMILIRLTLLWFLLLCTVKTCFIILLPVCVRLCLSSWLRLAKAFTQEEQLNTLGFWELGDGPGWCTRSCSCRRSWSWHLVWNANQTNSVGYAHSDNDSCGNFPVSPFLYNVHYMFYCLGLDPFEVDIIQSIYLFIRYFWWLAFLY